MTTRSELVLCAVKASLLSAQPLRPPPRTTAAFCPHNYKLLLLVLLLLTTCVHPLLCQRWDVALSHMIPAYGRDINEEPGLYDKVMNKARAVLLQGQVSGHRTARTNANQLFDRLDTKRKGKLNVNDLKAHLTLSKQQVDELLTRLEADKSGEISREKFDAGFATFVTGQVRQLRRALTVVPGSNSREPPTAA